MTAFLYYSHVLLISTIVEQYAASSVHITAVFLSLTSSLSGHRVYSIFMRHPCLFVVIICHFLFLTSLSCVCDSCEIAAATLQLSFRVKICCKRYLILYIPPVIAVESVWAGTQDSPLSAPAVKEKKETRSGIPAPIYPIRTEDSTKNRSCLLGGKEAEKNISGSFLSEISVPFTNVK